MSAQKLGCVEASACAPFVALTGGRCAMEVGGGVLSDCAFATLDAHISLPRRLSIRPLGVTQIQAVRLDRNLRADLHHAVGGQLEIARRVVGVVGEEDVEPVLPFRHA